MEEKVEAFFSRHDVNGEKYTTLSMSIFSKIFKSYNYGLRKSLSQMRGLSNSFKWAPSYYTYLLLSGTKLKRLLAKISKYRTQRIPNYLLKMFKKCIIYVGKGTANRDNSHLYDVKRAILKGGGLKSSKKNSIRKQWLNGGTLVVRKLHYRICVGTFSFYILAGKVVT